ncbi:permease [bacterium]|nr:permease [bacterium]
MDAGNIYLLIAFLFLLISALKDREKTKRALKVTGKIALTVLPVLFFIFILMGIISVLVPKETIAQWLGSGSGIKGILIGELVGCFALIQPAAVFPFAGILHNKGAGYSVLFAFAMTAILIGIVTLPAELKFLGKKFTIVRNVLTFIFVFLLSFVFSYIR